MGTKTQLSFTVAAVRCGQWGDTGKGKVVDLLAGRAKFIVRCTGGPNAGHTVVISAQQFIFHMLPCGILYDDQGKVNVIGTGTVVDPRALIEELKILDACHMTYGNLRISLQAKLILPQHLVLDRVKESSAEGKIGTTGRGIGPAYVDHYDRTGLIVNDLLNPKLFTEKLRLNLRHKVALLRTFNPQLVHDVMQHEHLCRGRLWNEETIFDESAIVDLYQDYGRQLKVFITDTDALVQKARRNGEPILLEGAQGQLLSVDYGTYPFVTSSDCSLAGMVKGAGLCEQDVDLDLAIAKGFYMTRVGEGPFPTEFGGHDSDTWCSTKGITKATEAQEFGELSVNDPDEFRQGVAIRMAGDEYGATTGRPRRTGWLDLPLLRAAIGTRNCSLVFTKLDVLDAFTTIKVCVAYRYMGPSMCWGNRHLEADDRLEVAIPHSDVLKHCVPIYKSFPGWEQPIKDVRTYDELPLRLRRLVEFVEEQMERSVRILSVGADRTQTIIRC